MTAESNKGVFIELSQPAILAFSDLFPPAKFEKYQAKLLFSKDPEHPDVKRLLKAWADVVRERWPGRDLKKVRPLFMDGDAEADLQAERGKPRESSRGNWILLARSKILPTLKVVQDGRVLTYDKNHPNRDTLKSQFFNGAEVFPVLKLMAYEGVGANPDGVACYLNHLGATGGGTPIAGGSKMSNSLDAALANYHIGRYSQESVVAQEVSDDEIPYA